MDLYKNKTQEDNTNKTEQQQKKQGQWKAADNT